MKISFYDTTLRDGAQGHGITFSADDKIGIIRLLDSLCIDYIEVCNFNETPPGEADSFYFPYMKLFQNGLNHSVVTAFGATCRPYEKPEDDPHLRAVVSSPFETVTIFGKSWLFHVTDVLHTTSEENLRMIRDTIKFLKANGRNVIFDAEHFFDGYSDNPEYALSVLLTAVDSGASSVVLCDTNGGMMPSTIGQIVSEVKRNIPENVGVGIHCHNDIGMAEAASAEAVLNGADSVQGCISGVGERCGNANLNILLPLLQLKLGYECVPEEKLRLLTPAVRMINELMNHAFNENEPFVGGHAFSHKAGMHIDGVSKSPRSFEHIDPAAVGNDRSYLVSCLSGRAAILGFLNDAAPEITGLNKNSDTVKDVLEMVKSRESMGFSYEDAYASLWMLLRNHLGLFKPAFELVNFQVNINESPENSLCTAIVKIKVGDEITLTAAEGDGPVNAIDNSLRKALAAFFPKVADIRLTDYRVRVLNSGKATASVVRVVIETTDGKRTWRTTGASHDIIDASWQALADSYEYALQLDK